MCFDTVRINISSRCSRLMYSNFGSGCPLDIAQQTTTLIISKEEMEDIM